MMSEQLIWFITSFSGDMSISYSDPLWQLPQFQLHFSWAHGRGPRMALQPYSKHPSMRMIGRGTPSVVTSGLVHSPRQNPFGNHQQPLLGTGARPHRHAWRGLI